MKIQFKILITLGLVFSVLFGSFTHTNASENSALQKNLSKHFKLTNDSKFIVSNSSDTTRNINFSRMVTSSPVHMGVFKETTVQVDGSSTYTFVALSLQSFKFSMINVNLENNELTDWTERKYSISDLNSESREIVVNGITFYYSSVTVTTKQILDSDLNVYGTNLDYNDFVKRLITLLMGDDLNLDSDYAVGELDKTLGYLHDLHRKSLITKTDENGFPIESLDKFTWSDSYPNYDTSYDVDLYVVCNVQERNMYLPWIKKNYTSLRTYVKSDKYKNFEFKVTNDELNAIFSSFHSPDGNKPSLYKVRAWNYDFYFRIVKDGNYGPWTIWKHTGEVLDGSKDGNVSVGDEDEDGNIIIDSDTDYGNGMPDDTDIGLGDGEVDAEGNIGEGQFDITNITSWINWFFNTLKSFLASMKDLPSLFASIFSFLPAPIVFFLSGSLVVVVALRFLGR